MRIHDLFEASADAEHFDALDRTGFFGAAGAGCVFLAQDTGRLLLAHRSADVEQPHTWGGWGGAINRGENPEEAVRREVSEEAGYHGNYELQPLFVFASGSFRYYNFLVIVDEEFKPQLDWETQGFEWCDWGHWPTPLHFGLVSLFGDPASAKKIQADIAAIKQNKT
jgi:8-oxo-dGTP pyrophosphatase MutT (NUDIX family)